MQNACSDFIIIEHKAKPNSGGGDAAIVVTPVQ